MPWEPKRLGFGISANKCLLMMGTTLLVENRINKSLCKSHLPATKLQRETSISWAARLSWHENVYLRPLSRGILTSK